MHCYATFRTSKLAPFHFIRVNLNWIVHAQSIHPSIIETNPANLNLLIFN